MVPVTFPSLWDGLCRYSAHKGYCRDAHMIKRQNQRLTVEPRLTRWACRRPLFLNIANRNFVEQYIKVVQK